MVALNMMDVFTNALVWTIPPPRQYQFGGRGPNGLLRGLYICVRIVVGLGRIVLDDDTGLGGIETRQVLDVGYQRIVIGTIRVS